MKILNDIHQLVQELGGIHKEIRKLTDIIPPREGKNRLIVLLERDDTFSKLTIENPELERSAESIKMWLGKKLTHYADTTSKT